MEPKIEEIRRHEGKPIPFFRKEYISEFVYGGIDGAITTFAVVAGATGAQADIKWVLIFGFANLIADGFSMSVGNYFSTKTENENYDKHRDIEYWEIEHLREKEVQEIRDIYTAKGFKGELLEQVVDVITADNDIWVDTMMKEELEMTQNDRAPIKTATATFLSFNLIGLIPLLAYMVALWVDIPNNTLFWMSSLATGIGLVIIGSLKSHVTENSRIRGILETLLLGGLAAVLAYYVGVILASQIL